MNRAHSYAQIPAAESQGPTAVQSSSRHGPSSSHAGGYAALNAQPDEDDDFEDAQEDSVMLQSSSSTGGPSTASAPRRAVYPDEDEISIAPEASSSSSSSSPYPSTPSRTQSQSAPRNTGARTTNVSFLARITGRQRPGTEARRMIQSTMDGVFSNLSAKPRVERPVEEELPPSYKSAALDVSPAYYESTLMASGYDEDDLLIEGLPVGGMFGFMWNVIISMSFQFVGFFLTYLLHTSHATKNGSKTGLGLTFISMGFQMMTGSFRTQDGSEDEMDQDTGYVTPPTSGGAGGSSSPASLSSLRSIAEYTWLSYFMLTLGGLIVVQSLWEFARAKKAELRLIAANGPSEGSRAARDAEESVPASMAAGYELSSIVSGASSSSSGSGSAQGTHVIMTVTGPSV
ncbi:hypothetical protein EMPS_03958 [Entomortierella parvispora]|uniref:Metal homeostatis protein bsd2 n=1 Tax=Entomortierella parvispora TaxID=205924 RepID=A0A9P3H885_9FUNG|nr:hypothetical protein EMPS_03958 [Entomortierella parvispora]